MPKTTDVLELVFAFLRHKGAEHWRVYGGSEGPWLAPRLVWTWSNVHCLEAPSFSPPYRRSPDPLCPDTSMGLMSVNTPVKTASESSSPPPSISLPCSRPTLFRNAGLIISQLYLPKAVCSRDAKYLINRANDTRPKLQEEEAHCCATPG